MPFASVTGIPQLLAAGTPWASISGYFESSSDWGDGTGRSPERIEVALAATGLSLVVRGTQQPVRVPAIATGVGQLVSPPVSFRLTATDTAGNVATYVMTPRVLNADGSSNWHLNSQNAGVVFADNAGPAPVGLTQTAADLRYAQLTLLASDTQHGLARFATNVESVSNTPPANRALRADALHAQRHVFGNADAIPRVGDAGGLAGPGALTVTDATGGTLGTATITQLTTTPTMVFYKLAQQFTSAGAGTKLIRLVPPSGWQLVVFGVTVWNSSPVTIYAAALHHSSNLFYYVDDNTALKNWVINYALAKI